MSTQPEAIRVADAFCDQWTTAPAQCLDCGHKWVAVYPLGAADLECPQCHSTDTARGDEHEHD